MLKQIKKLNTQAFTIIEVMIVLAIAGMIILVVLLAVPAVQRNGRNTAIKNDAAAIAGGITEFESNNNGSAPTAFGGSGTGTINITGAAGTTAATARTQGATTVGTTPSTTATLPTVTGAGAINVWIGHSCNGNASTRAFAIVYNTETAGGTAPQCLDT